MSLTFKDVTEILKLIDASQCDELVLELDGARLVVRRNTAGTASASFTSDGGEEKSVLFEDVGRKSDEISGTPTPAPEQTKAVKNTGMMDIRAPMVGTFYRRPSPDEAVFVEEGDRVKKGDSLCLIEVMKLFTTLKAPADGQIISISPEDGALVEFNQLLFQIAT